MFLSTVKLTQTWYCCTGWSVFEAHLMVLTKTASNQEVPLKII